MVVIAMADRAEIKWFGCAKERICPLMKKMSSMARIKILLPNRLPIARSIASIFTADSETTSSGRDVVRVIKIFPALMCRLKIQPRETLNSLL